MTRMQRLPGLVIGSGQCLILRTRCAAEGSVVWLLLGALQFWELDRRFRGGDWWVALSAVNATSTGGIEGLH